MQFVPTIRCLQERWEKSPPAWNPLTGDPEVDELVRFRYVQADDLGKLERNPHVAAACVEERTTRC